CADASPRVANGSGERAVQTGRVPLAACDVGWPTCSTWSAVPPRTQAATANARLIRADDPFVIRMRPFLVHGINARRAKHDDDDPGSQGETTSNDGFRTAEGCSPLDAAL